MSQFTTLQTWLPTAGRVLLALIFVAAGAGKFMDPSGTAGYMAAYGIPMSALLVWPVALVEFGAGVLLLLGWRAQLAALVLVAFTIPATLIFHAFWNVDPAQAQLQQVMFLKNLAIAGGLLYVMAYGPGRGAIGRV
jgi:putative oxidoreductase